MIFMNGTYDNHESTKKCEQKQFTFNSNFNFDNAQASVIRICVHIKVHQKELKFNCVKFVDKTV